MRLTKHTDYSLRLLMYLAIKPDELQTIKDLSGRFNVSRNHLMKIVNKLVILGYIDSVRGRNGGLRLAKPKDSIRVSAVVEDMEPTLELVDCEADGGCPYYPSCKLKLALQDASKAFLEFLDGVTLADLVVNDKQLVKLVG